jgi:predicted PurR-regulated permease PerM
VRSVAALIVGTLLMLYAFVQHGWWGFLYVPLACLIMGAVIAAFEYE